MQKFEAVAEVGDTIKCYDFEPFPGREERYVVGRVTEKGFLAEYGFAGYVVEVLKDTVFPAGERTEIVAPFQTMFMEFDGRITKVEAV
jgi:hypothetical protein